jgi:hypothetical protein
LTRLTSHPDDDQRLGSEKGEYYGSQDGGEQNFVDPIALVCLLEHIQGKGQSWKDTVDSLVSIPEPILKKSRGEGRGDIGV